MKVNFCTFNHPLRGIQDQIWYLDSLLRQHEIEFSCSPYLKADSLNLILENFVESDLDIVRSFCEKWRKSVGVVMSEHVEMIDGHIYFDCARLESPEYIGNRAERFFSVCAISEHVLAFFRLGELPVLGSFDAILPGATVYSLPYPVLQVSPPSLTKRKNADIVFTGGITAHRQIVLGQLKVNHKIVYSDILLGDHRDELYESAKVAVNIPQAEDWLWVSPMRVLYGLRKGLPTIHIGSLDETRFAQEVLSGVSLKYSLGDPLAAWEKQLNSYNRLACSDLNSHFPAGLFEIWREIEDV